MAVEPVRQRSVSRNAFTTGFWTGVSRVLGLARQILHAGTFGTSTVQSAFVLAFQVPNLFRRLFGEGALSAAFIPVFTGNLRKGDREASRRLASRMLTLLALVLGGAALLGILLAFALQPFVPETSRWFRVLPLLRILLPYAPLICMAAITMGILQSLQEFRAPAAAPCLLNLVWIGVLSAILPFLSWPLESKIRLLSWAILAAGALQFAFLALVLRHKGIRLRPDTAFRADADIHEILRNAAPAILGSAAFQINTFLDGIIAMWAAPWAPSCLQYAELIYDLPIGLVITAFATVLLPTLSHSLAASDLPAARRTFTESLQNILVLTLPAAAALFLLSSPLVILFYMRGAFDADSAARTAGALSCYALGLPFVGIQKAATAFHNAAKDTRTPMRISLLCIALNLVLNIVFVLTLPQVWRHCGLAISTTISTALNAFLLLRSLRRRTLVDSVRPIVASFLRSGGAAFFMAIALVFLLFFAFSHADGVRPVLWKDSLLAIGLSAPIGLLVYAGALALLTPGGLRPILRSLFHRR